MVGGGGPRGAGVHLLRPGRRAVPPVTARSCGPGVRGGAFRAAAGRVRGSRAAPGRGGSGGPEGPGGGVGVGESGGPGRPRWGWAWQGVPSAPSAAAAPPGPCGGRSAGEGAPRDPVRAGSCGAVGAPRCAGREALRQGSGRSLLFPRLGGESQARTLGENAFSAKVAHLGLCNRLCLSCSLHVLRRSPGGQGGRGHLRRGGAERGPCPGTVGPRTPSLRAVGREASFRRASDSGPQGRTRPRW